MGDQLSLGTPLRSRIRGLPVVGEHSGYTGVAQADGQRVEIMGNFPTERWAKLENALSKVMEKALQFGSEPP